MLTRINAAAAWAAGALLVAILAVVLYEVAARFLFNHAAAWAFDFTSYALLFIVFLAAARTLEQDQHVRIDMLVARLRGRGRVIVEVCALALSIVYLAVFLWTTILELREVIQTGAESPSILAIPLRYVVWIMPAGALLLLATALVRLFVLVSRRGEA